MKQLKIVSVIVLAIVALSAVSGEINVEDSAGDVEASASSGDITVTELAGEFQLTTTSGEIRVEGEVGNGKANSSSGDITAEFSKVSGSIQMSATSGELRLTIPKETEFMFDAETASGDINTFFDENLPYDKQGNNALGTIGNDNRIQIEMNCSSGDINVDEK